MVTVTCRQPQSIFLLGICQACDAHKVSDIEMNVRADWSAFEGMPVAWVNQLAAQVGPAAGDERRPDSIALFFGHAEAPLLTGSQEEIRAQVAGLATVRVQPAAKIVMSRERAEELLRIIASTLGQYDTAANSEKAALDVQR